MMVVFLTACIFFQLYPTFDSYFIADDFKWLWFANNDDSVLSAAFHPSVGDWTTPVPNVIFWLSFKAFGFDPHGYYVVMALIHLINSGLVYGLVYLVTKRVGVAFGSASIFALHFIHFSDWGPLVWISAFVQLVVASFYLLALGFFVRYLYFGKKYSYVGALVCFGLALASKETAVTLPLLLLTWCLIELPLAERRLTRIAIVLGPFWIVLGVYLLYKLMIQQTSDRYFEVGLYGFGKHLISNWKYFSNLVMPNPGSPPVHSYLLRNFPSWTLSLAYLAANLVRLGLVVAGITLWWRGSEHVRLWIALSLITYVPFIGFVGGHAGANRYFYLPTIGFSALLAAGLWWMLGRASKQRGASVCTSLLTIIILGFWAYNLLPIRAWQKEMRENSRPIQLALYAVDNYNAKRATPVAKLYLTGFPLDQSGDLQKAIRLVYGVDTILVDTEQKDETELSMDTLMLMYEANRVVIRQP